MRKKVEYTPELAESICTMLIDGMPLSRICARNDIPSKHTVLRWLQEYPEFYEAYFKAKQLQAEGLVDEIVDIADNSTNDYMEWVTKSGRKMIVPDHENIQRSRLRVDARKWLAQQLFPRVYGERVQLNAGEGVSAQLVIIGRDEPKLIEHDANQS